MKNFKKTAIMIGSYALVAALAVGGTLAFMTDTEKKTNVMPLGEGVDIALIEQQRNDDGTALEDFEDGKQLLPIIGSAQGNNDEFGLAQAENYVDKIVRVENIGTTNAYVRVLAAFPAAWDADKASDMPIHWNHSDSFDPDGAGELAPMKYNWTADFEETATIDGVEYNIYSYTYKEAIAPGYITEAAITGFYMDSRVDFDDETGKYTMNGEVIDWDLDNFIVPVYAQAIQVDGFEDAEAAFENMVTNPWEDGVDDTSGVEYSEGTNYVNKNIVVTNGTDAVTASGEAVVYIQGGYYDAGIGDQHTAVWAYDNATVYIEDGYFYASGENAEGGYNDVIYAKDNAKIYISGGFFEGDARESDGQYFLLNLKDNSNAVIEVTGGTFVNFNPADTGTEPAGVNDNFVADGYKVVAETQANGDVWYTVVAE